MDTVHIHRLTTRYRLTESTRAARSRLDQLMRTVFADALEQALSWAGVTEHEEICIRQLHIPVRLRLSKPDSALVLAWSIALAEAIKQATDDRSGNVIRYGSRVQALIDLAVGVVQEDYRRIWAWRQLDLWHAGTRPAEAEAVHALLQALTGEAPLILPVLHTLAGLGQLDALTNRLNAEQWVMLTHAALDTVCGTTALLEIATSPEPGSASIRQTAHQLLTASSLTTALAKLATTAPAVRRAMAVLIVLDTDPNALRAPLEVGHTLLHTVSEALEIIAAVTTREQLFDSPSPSLFQPEEGMVATKTNPVTSHTAPLRQREERETQATREQFPVPLVRRQAPTCFAGLLFLLGVVEDLGLPDEILAQPIFAHRLSRWVLHQLALVLVPAETDDPAVLAFAGLLPDSDPPANNEDPLAEDEAAVIGRYAARIGDNVCLRLQRRDRQEALQFVCHRPATIVADPGWIEVHFALTDASVEIRRAALDLNPEYLPWLGVVVKFIYE